MRDDDGRESSSGKLLVKGAKDVCLTYRVIVTEDAVDFKQYVKFRE